jgi:hypothetical protein
MAACLHPSRRQTVTVIESSESQTGSGPVFKSDTRTPTVTDGPVGPGGPGRGANLNVVSTTVGLPSRILGGVLMWLPAVRQGVCGALSGCPGLRAHCGSPATALPVTPLAAAGLSDSDCPVGRSLRH